MNTKAPTKPAAPRTVADPRAGDVVVSKYFRAPRIVEDVSDGTVSFRAQREITAPQKMPLGKWRKWVKEIGASLKGPTP